MTATEQLIAKQVSDVFPASVDDLPLARRCAPRPHRAAALPAGPAGRGDLVGADRGRRLRPGGPGQGPRPLSSSTRPPRASTATASTRRRGSSTRPGSSTPTTSRASSAPQGSRPRPSAASTPPLKLAETLAAYERGEINVLINAQLLAEGWNSPRATVCMHLAPTASRRVYQQRIGRIMRMHPRKEAGVVVDFVDPRGDAQRAHDHAPLPARLGLLPPWRARHARRRARRVQRRARRKLSPAPWLVPVTPDPRRRVAVIAREWERVDPSPARGRRAAALGPHRGPPAPLRRAPAVRREARARPSRECREVFLMSCAAENPNRRLRLSALGDRVARRVDRASFDDLVTMVTSAPTWEKDRVQGVRILLRAIGEGKVEAPEDILSRWTWRLARATRKLQDRRAGVGPAGCEAPSRGPDELPRSPPRGERRAARQRRARAADPGRCRAARLRRGVHADRAAADRPACASGSGRSSRSRTRSRTTCRRRSSQSGKSRRRRRKRKQKAEQQKAEQKQQRKGQARRTAPERQREEADAEGARRSRAPSPRPPAAD